MKLTDKQRAALPEIGVGNVKMVRFGTGANRIIGPVATSVVGRMISLGLARWPNGPFGDQICELTDAGRAAMAITHPIPIGATVISVEGEWDTDCDDGDGGDRRRETGPMARGRVLKAVHADGCGWIYDVAFPDSGVEIRLIERVDPLDDPARYRFERA